jgi:hypothetical protein
LKTQLNLHKRLLQLSSTWIKKTLTFKISTRLL